MNLLMILPIVFTLVSKALSAMQFCEEYGANGYNDALQYDDRFYMCLSCEFESRMVAKGSQFVCCKGKISLSQKCGSPLEGDTACNATRKRCDGIKDCYDGIDEVGCESCGFESFSCNQFKDGDNCIIRDKVCDGHKDCEYGKDETLCEWGGGVCEGFLCSDGHRCVGLERVCDGKKDCVDGSDEINCQYCVNQFRCEILVRLDNDATSAQCVGKFRICDDIVDCANGQDEENCHRWGEWASWSGCGAPSTCRQQRTRNCLSKLDAPVDVGFCSSVFDPSGAIGSPNPHVNLKVCPECLPPPTTSKPGLNDTRSTTHVTTPSTTAIPHNILATTNAAMGTTNTEATETQTTTTESTEGATTTLVPSANNTEDATTETVSASTGFTQTTALYAETTATTADISMTESTETTQARTDTTRGSPKENMSTTKPELKTTADASKEKLTSATIRPQTTEKITKPPNYAFVIGMAVLGLLLLVVMVIFCLCCLHMKRTKTGFWRPPKRVPSPEKSSLPMWFNDADNHVKRGTPPISHPYPIPDDELEMQMHTDPHKLTLGLGSEHGGAIDSGIEETNSTTSRESPRR